MYKANILLVSAVLRAPEVLPRRPEGNVLTQRERRQQQQGKGKKKMTAEEEEEEEESSPERIHVQGYGGRLKDTKGGPLMQWSDDAESVAISANLPKWSGPIGGHARAVTAAMYGKKNAREMFDLGSRELPELAAQSLLHAAVVNHHMGRVFEEAIAVLQARIAKHKQKLANFRAKAYDPENPDFMDAMEPHVVEAVDDVLGVLREKGALTAEFENATFATLFPKVAEAHAREAAAAAAATAKEAAPQFVVGESSRGAQRGDAVVEEEEAGEVAEEEEAGEVAADVEESGSQYHPNDRSSVSDSGTRSGEPGSETSATSTSSESATSAAASEPAASPDRKKRKT